MHYLLILVLGPIGGFISARFLWNKSLGKLWDSIVGIIGAGLGAWSVIQSGFFAGSSNLINYQVICMLAGGACLHTIVIMFKSSKEEEI